MAQFGEVIFEIAAEWTAVGIYDGRRFRLDASGDGVIDGDFNDEERRFIWTQWEMQQ